ncbi:MAG: hypothetical protein ACRC62_34245 [Microcoleus sp.]
MATIGKSYQKTGFNIHPSGTAVLNLVQMEVIERVFCTARQSNTITGLMSVWLQVNSPASLGRKASQFLETRLSESQLHLL